MRTTTLLLLALAAAAGGWWCGNIESIGSSVTKDVVVVRRLEPVVKNEDEFAVLEQLCETHSPEAILKLAEMVPHFTLKQVNQMLGKVERRYKELQDPPSILVQALAERLVMLNPNQAVALIQRQSFQGSELANILAKELGRTSTLSEVEDVKKFAKDLGEYEEPFWETFSSHANVSLIDVVHYSMREKVLDRWAQQDLASAQTWAMGETDPMTSPIKIMAMISGKYDPQAAMKWIGTFADRKIQVEATGQVYVGWAKSDLESAVIALKAEPVPAVREAAMVDLGDELAKLSLPKMLALIDKTGGDAISEFRDLSGLWGRASMEKSPAATLLSVFELSEYPLRKNMIISACQFHSLNPSRELDDVTIECLQKEPPGELRRDAVRSIIDGFWSSQDRCWKYVDVLKGTEDYIPVAEKFAEHLASRDPSRFVKMWDQLPLSAQKLARPALLEKWKESDLEEAEKWVHEHPEN